MRAVTAGLTTIVGRTIGARSGCLSAAAMAAVAFGMSSLRPHTSGTTCGTLLTSRKLASTGSVLTCGASERTQARSALPVIRVTTGMSWPSTTVVRPSASARRSGRARYACRPSRVAGTVQVCDPTVTVISPSTLWRTHVSACAAVMPPTGTPATLTPGAITPAGTGEAVSAGVVEDAYATPSGAPKASTAAAARRRRDQSTWAVLHFLPTRCHR